MTGSARSELEVAVGSPFEVTHLAVNVLRVEVENAPPLVAKLDDSGRSGLEDEASALRDLREHAPAPKVLHSSPRVLLMEWCAGRTGVGDGAAEDAASALAALHAARGDSFGYARPTRIGGLVQSNTPRNSWLEFFAESRLLGPVRAARDEGRLDDAAVELIERVAARLPELAGDPSSPALVHGDLWSGNVLTTEDALSAFIDPAPYFGHPEVDLAFATMFGGFSDRFFEAYGERAGDASLVDEGFWQERRDLWNLYPLLVHVRLFGGSYVTQLIRSARRFA